MIEAFPTSGTGMELKTSVVANGQAASSGDFNREWDRVFARLEQIRDYQDDWDGEGSLAPRPGVADAVISMAGRWKTTGEKPPIGASCSDEGTIVLEWRFPNETRKLEFGNLTEVEETWIRPGANPPVQSHMIRMV